MPTSHPTVSVILPAYNAERYIGTAIQSILNQTFTDLELLIIDDGSTDGTLAIANSFNDPRIRVIQNPKNLGVSKTRNAGIAKAKGELIALQDADDVSFPNRLEVQVQFLQSKPDIALVSGNRISIDEHGNPKISKPMPPFPTYQSMKKRNEINCTNSVFRKYVFDAVGGFNPHFRMAEDYELWLRIVQKHPIANLPEPLCNIMVHSQSMTGKDPGALVVWRMLALAVTEGLVTQAEVKRYYENGIETFAAEMPPQLKEEYLTHLAAGLKNAQQYKQSLAAFRELKDLTGGHWKIWRNIVKMWVKSRGVV